MCPKILYNAQCYMQHSSRDDYVMMDLICCKKTILLCKTSQVENTIITYLLCTGGQT